MVNRPRTDRKQAENRETYYRDPFNHYTDKIPGWAGKFLIE